MWITGLNLSKSTQANVNGFTSAKNKIGICNQNKKFKEWLLDPKFLKKSEKKWKLNRTITPVSSDDSEMKKDLVVNYMSTTSDILFALVIGFKSNLTQIEIHTIMHKASDKTLKKNQSLLDTTLMEETKNIIIKMVQKRSFNDEFNWLKPMKDKTLVNKALDRRSKISSLDSFLEKDGIILVGGSLDNSFINSNSKYPILLPKHGKVTTLIIQHHHKMAAYPGLGVTLNQIRSSRYWIVGADLAVNNFIFRMIVAD